MNYTLSLLLVATAFLTGCEAQSIDVSPVNALAEFDGVTYARKAPTQSRDTLVARMEAQRAALDAIETALTGIALDDARRADLALDQALSRLSPEAQSLGRQFAAGIMIDVFLDRAPDSRERQEIAARHTRSLVTLQSPEARLVLAGLETAGDRLDPETRRRYAQQALVPATAWIASEQSGPSGSAAGRVRSQSVMPRLARTESAVVELRRIAGA